MPNFKAVFPDSTIFREVFKAVTQLIQEGTLLIYEEGVKLCEMSDNHVAMVGLYIPRDYFSEYNIEAEMEVGVDLIDMLRMLKFSRHEAVSMSLAEVKGGQKFQIEIENRRFYLPILYVDKTATCDRIDKLEHGLEIELDPSEFNRIIQEAKTIGEDLRIRLDADNKKVFFESESEIGSLYQYILELEESEAVMSWNIHDNVDVIYDVGYLEKIVKPYRLASNLKLECSTEKPARISFLIDGEIDLKYLLAPKII
ncbi:MAG: hypothetical protein ACP6IP_10465 [Candidatus Njordarchaeia archaeon]